MKNRPRSFEGLRPTARTALAAVVSLDGSGSWDELQKASSLSHSQLYSALFYLQELGLVSIGDAPKVVRPRSWGVRYCGGRNKAKAYLDQARSS